MAAKGNDVMVRWQEALKLAPEIDRCIMLVELWQRNQDLTGNLRDNAGKIQTLARAITGTTSQQMQKSYSTAGRVGISVVLTGLALRTLGFFIHRGVTRPLKRAIEALSQNAGGVAAASGQVSWSSQQLAEGASEQAAAIEETSSSLEEMSSMTKQNADNANQANKLMSGTKETVERASETMDKLTASMGEISGQVKRPPRSSRQSTKSLSRQICLP